MADANPLPKGIGGKAALRELINAAAKKNISEVEIDIEQPIPSEGNPLVNTRVVITSPNPNYLGPMEFYYMRRELADVMEGIEPVLFPVKNGDDAYSVLQLLSNATGVQITEQDIVPGNVEISGKSFELTAAEFSYFFVPGSKIQLLGPGDFNLTLNGGSQLNLFEAATAAGFDNDGGASITLTGTIGSNLATVPAVTTGQFPDGTDLTIYLKDANILGKNGAAGQPRQDLNGWGPGGDGGVGGDAFQILPIPGGSITIVGEPTSFVRGAGGGGGAGGGNSAQKQGTGGRGAGIDGAATSGTVGQGSAGRGGAGGNYGLAGTAGTNSSRAAGKGGAVGRAFVGSTNAILIGFDETNTAGAIL